MTKESVPIELNIDGCTLIGILLSGVSFVLII